MSFGRTYEFEVSTDSWPVKEGRDVPPLLLVKSFMEPTEHNAPRVMWTVLNEDGTAQDDDLWLPFDAQLSEVCVQHWREHSGDYIQPGVQGGEAP